MRHCIAPLFEQLLAPLLPPRQHRTTRRRTPVAQPYATLILLLRKEAPTLVRLYVLTPADRRHRRKQRQRRRALWLAVHGIDVGPRLIHGVEVAA